MDTSRSRQYGWILALVIAPMIAALSARAAVRHVPSEYPTIQAGILATDNGDTVLVAPGTYTGQGNRNIQFFGRSILVRSEAGSRMTVLDIGASKDDPARGFTFADNGLVQTLEGFTIENGFMGAGVSPDRHELSAGGIQVNLVASPTLRDIVIRHCRSEFTGGGMSIEFGASPLVEDLVIVGCEAGQLGGGLSIETGASPILRRCLITGNRAPGGGGVFSNASPMFEQCTIAGNRADVGGGVECQSPGEVSFESSIVWGNCALDGSDQLYLRFSALATFACSGIDTSGVVADGVLELADDVLALDPWFCGAEDCQSAPAGGGDYTLDVSSPYAGKRMSCGRTAGALDLACDRENPTLPTTWGRLKSTFSPAARAKALASPPSRR